MAIGAALAALAFSSTPQTKLSLSVNNVIQAFGPASAFYAGTNATLLFDEQEVAGDPANGSGGTALKTSWETSWDSTWYGPQLHPFMLLDLHGTFDVTSIWMYRSWGSWNVSGTVSDVPADPTRAAGTFGWDIGHGVPSGQGWLSSNFSNPARGSYVSISVSGSPGNSLLEFVVYGTPAALSLSEPRTVSASPLPLPTLSLLLGTNGFALDTMANLSGVVGAMREYDDWDWTEHVQDQSAFQPTADNTFFLDDWYTNLTALGIRAHHCMQKSPAWLHNNTANEEQWKPLTADQLAVPGSAMVAASYGVVASHTFQVAARYGSVAVPASSLKLAPNQPVKSGLGVMTGLEVFNEVDGTWNGGRNGYFAPYEYAAMASAAYDGHCGSMGPLMGVKAADPAFPMIHSGLAGVGVAADYFEGVRQWAVAFRPDGKFPADILNVHAYCRNDAGTAGVPPEACTLEADLRALCAYRDAKLPGLPVWLSEFGYDTVGGPSVAPPLPGFTQQEVQGMWLVRTVLMLARLGSPGGGACVSRAQMYMLADVESTSGGVFATSGLLASSDFQYQAKVSWFFYALFLRTLGGHTHTGMVAIPGAPPTLMAQCFVDGSGQYALVLWSATASGSVVQGVAVPVRSTACPVHTSARASVTVLTPAKGAPEGNATSVPVVGATVTVDVTEVPVILLDAPAWSG